MATRNDLMLVAKELNNVLELEPKIKIGRKHNSKEVLLTAIKEAISLVEKGDKISRKTQTILEGLNLIFNKPGKLKEKRGVGEVKNFIGNLLKEGKWKRKEIIGQTIKQFPDRLPSTIGTLLSDSKNFDYNKFDSLVIENENRIMSFEN